MLIKKVRSIIVFLLILLFVQSGTILADTWHLGEGQQWQSVSGESRYLQAVAEIKKLVNSGQTKEVRQAFCELKKEFPEIAGPDLDAFIKGEILFSEGKFVKASRAYDKFLKEFSDSKFYDVVLDRQFAIATAFLAGEKVAILKVFKIKGYAEGIRIMERISDRAGDAPIAVRASLAIARNYEKRGKFEDAYFQWSLISSRWPTGETGRDSLLAMARCKHSAYKGPNYDVSDLISAKSYYNNFRLRYTEDAKELKIDKKLELIEEQIAMKRFSTGEYYQQTGNVQSANFYYQMVLDNWPNSTAAKMLKQKTDDRKRE